MTQVARTRSRSDFVPADLDGSSWEVIEPLLTALRDREIDSPEAFERWLMDRSELESAVSESGATLYIAMTCHTESDEAQAAYTRFIEEIEPKVKPLAFALDRRHVELAERFTLPRERYEVIDRDTRAEVELYRDENVPIQTELDRLSQQYQKITGAMTVEFDGKERTLPQMGVYQEAADRAVRESSWRAVADRRLQDADRIDGIYDRMVERRDTMARNAGFDSYIGYTFKSKKRFDYGPEDCEAFHLACEEVVMPFNRRQDERRRELLGVETLRPWDVGVDPKGRPPLRPFEDGPDLVRRTRAALRSLSPELDQMFAVLGDGANTNGAADGESLDLDSRKGKAPGGYQYMRDRMGKPFIFMNASGLHRDIETMVHEAGHAFHSMYCTNDPLLHYRHAPIEFCEVASMAMELLTMTHWGGPDAYYQDEENLARAQRRQLESSVGFLPWIATIDAFQHWVYANPAHTRDQRTARWLELDQRFGHAGHTVDWSGLDAQRANVWQRQGHLFSHPFYYIEYGIAQLGALQLWLQALEKGEAHALDAYARSMRLGGSRPLPELFETAGLEFDFGPDTVSRLVDRVEAELEKLPD